MHKSRKELKQEKLAAFEAIVSEYESALLRYASRIVNDFNSAQDIVQNTFIKLHKTWKDDFSPSPQISSWLYRVAHNCAVDYIRKQSRRSLLHKKHAEEIPHFMMPNRGDAFNITESMENAIAALKSLDIREQQLVSLKIYEECSYKEISEITGLSISNVGYILHHAMKKMALKLNSETNNEM